MVTKCNICEQFLNRHLSPVVINLPANDRCEKICSANPSAIFNGCCSDTRTERLKCLIRCPHRPEHTCGLPSQLLDRRPDIRAAKKRILATDMRISETQDELDDLVAESLTYARFDLGAPQIDWQPCLLEPWLQQITASATRGRRHIEIHCKNLLIHPDREVRLEPRYMGRAVGNLIQNAVRHAKQRIEITLADEGKDCLIHVDDDGPGIPKDDRLRVFRAFTRLDSSRNRDTGGFGLGLAIVRRVVTWHGGRVQVSDSPLGGARLTIRWPGLPDKVVDASGPETA